ncbi:hypothetical protein K438DRAFT_1767112 [Mycena galopus ATCC 62051]|nr:hypothetical protein K438DRAFT_1767112 [Mycena galopus ATCC 62051]
MAKLPSSSLFLAFVVIFSLDAILRIERIWHPVCGSKGGEPGKVGHRSLEVKMNYFPTIALHRRTSEEHTLAMASDTDTNIKGEQTVERAQERKAAAEVPLYGPGLRASVRQRSEECEQVWKSYATGWLQIWGRVTAARSGAVDAGAGRVELECVRNFRCAVKGCEHKGRDQRYSGVMLLNCAANLRRRVCRPPSPRDAGSLWREKPAARNCNVLIPSLPNGVATVVVEVEWEPSWNALSAPPVPSSPSISHAPAFPILHSCNPYTHDGPGWIYIMSRVRRNVHTRQIFGAVQVKVSHTKDFATRQCAYSKCAVDWLLIWHVKLWTPNRILLGMTQESAPFVLCFIRAAEALAHESLRQRGATVPRMQPGGVGDIERIAFGWMYLLGQARTKKTFL